MLREPNRSILPGLRRLLALLSLLALLFSTGCATVRVTDPARTATEQFLMTEAATRAVDQLSVDSLRDKVVFVDGQYIASYEQPFIMGEVRSKLLKAGARLTAKREEAKVIVEVRSNGVGIDRYDFLLGLPPIAVPQVVNNAATTLATPEIAFMKNQRQRGYASIAIVAYWSGTGEILTSSGPFVGKTMREDYWFLGLGPRTVGNIPPTQSNP